MNDHYVSAVRVWQGDEGTESADIWINRNAIVTMRMRQYWDSAEEKIVDGTEVALTDGRLIQLGDSILAMLNR